MNEELMEFLQHSFAEYVAEKRRRVSLAEWARYLGVSNASLSQWMNGNREPTGDNVHLLAAKLGVKVYDLLGVPRLLPDNPSLVYITENWYSLSKDQQDEIMKMMEDYTNEETELGTQPAV